MAFYFLIDPFTSQIPHKRRVSPSERLLQICSLDRLGLPPSLAAMFANLDPLLVRDLKISDLCVIARRINFVRIIIFFRDSNADN